MKNKIHTDFISRRSSPYIIAEAGVAHFGQYEKALRLLNLAVAAGADAFKVQVYSTETLFHKDQNYWKNRLRPRQLNIPELLSLKKEAVIRSIDFIVTPHDSYGLEACRLLDPTAIKIGSGEVGNMHFVKEVASLKKPLIVSTGMHTIHDVNRLVQWSHSSGTWLALLHCISSYPTPEKDCNLKSMLTLSKFDISAYGYSDHTSGILACIIASALGAQIIEKHISLDFYLEDANDWKVSADLGRLSRLVSDCKSAYVMLGKDAFHKRPETESAALKWATKQAIYSKNLSPGDILQSSDIEMVRCGGSGLTWQEVESLLGLKLRSKSIRGDIVKKSHFQP